MRGTVGLDVFIFIRRQSARTAHRLKAVGCWVGTVPITDSDTWLKYQMPRGVTEGVLYIDELRAECGTGVEFTMGGVVKLVTFLSGHSTVFLAKVLGIM